MCVCVLIKRETWLYVFVRVAVDNNLKINICVQTWKSLNYFNVHDSFII